MIETAPPPATDNTIHLTHRHTGDTIYRGQAPSVGAAIHLLSHSGARLRGVDLRGQDLSRCILNGIRIPEADLTGADLSHSHIVGADLRGCEMSRVNLIGANLSNANLQCVNLERATLLQTKLHFADLTEARCEHLESIGADFSHATLRKADFRGAQLAMAKFRCAEMEEINLQGTELHDADFSRAELHRADLRFCPITLPQLQSASLDQARRELFEVLTSMPRTAWPLRQALQDGATRPTLVETVLMASHPDAARPSRLMSFCPIEILWQSMRTPLFGRSGSPIARLIVNWIDTWHAQFVGAFDGQPWPAEGGVGLRQPE